MAGLFRFYLANYGLFSILDGSNQNHAYEEVMLLPPKQFRDTPSPVCSSNRSNVEEAGAVDNILYHIYESPKKKPNRLTGQLLKKETPSVNNVQGLHTKT